MSDNLTYVESPEQSTCYSQSKEEKLPWIQRTAKEPLLHFLLLATALFAVYRLTSGPIESEAPDSITVTQQRIDSLVQTFSRTWQRPPTTQELRGLIDDYIKEEVFYREALKMGLDRDDTLIRRRLRQKLEFLAEDLASVTEPIDDELKQIMAKNPEDYSVDRRFSFRQVFFRIDRDGESADLLATELLGRLQQDESSLMLNELGDPTMLPQDIGNQSETQIANQFGPQFAKALADLLIGEWSGPIESTYGIHLVFLRHAEPGRDPTLPEVRDHLRREWFADRRAKSKQQFFESLLEKYEVTIEPLEGILQEEESGQ